MYDLTHANKSCMNYFIKLADFVRETEQEF